jgi:DNA (cytosine-5)-methyltransferase 1
VRYLSVCSGIEAATQAWHPLGWKPVAFSEIEAFPSAVLAHHYPDVPNRGDMTKFQDWPDDTVDLLCGGTPCQSFSVAGLRQGLADPRGNLMLTFGAIAGRYRPRWLVWENVPGVLSSNGGRDFAAFLGLLGELGYGWAYRVLDAQHVRTRRFPFAVPQRRRRVFVVGYLGDWRRAAAVLFDRESLSGHPAPRREAGQRPAPTISARPTGGGGLGTDFDLDGGLIANSGSVGYCLTASAQQSLDAETETLIAVAHALRGEGHDASEDGTGRGTPLVPVAHPLPVAFAQNTRDEVRLIGGDGQSVGALGAEPGMKQQAYIAMQGAEPFTIMERGREGQQSLESRQDGTANAILTPNGGRGGMGVGAIALPWAVRRLTPRECERLQGFPDDFTLLPDWSARASRDDLEETARWIWTDDNRANGMSWEEALRLARHPDGPRYKALGNSWAVNVAEWVGERIAEVDAWE